jgi:hypothetical protein
MYPQGNRNREESLKDDFETTKERTSGFPEDSAAWHGLEGTSK